MNKIIERPQRETDAGHKIFTNVVRLPQQDSGNALSIVRLNNKHIGEFKRRTAVFIQNTHNRKWTIRYIMGNGGTVKGLTKSSLAIDYDGICDLAVQYEQPARIIIRKATFNESLMWLLKSPDLNIRLNTRIALLSAVLAIYSVMLTFGGMA
ncbi:hypothetical protein VB10N_46270 [Vibrio sp. 10N]|nr:hypothetical protein VB10N_46270 [Vibrio sp. 10N]